MKRRMKLIPFEVQIPEEQRDKDLPDKLRKEAPGILRWIVAGARAWCRDGLHDPPMVKAAVEEYMNEEDLFFRWRDECCTESPAAVEATAALYKSFQRWCEAQGMPRAPMPQIAFGRRMKKEGYSLARTDKLKGWRGLSIRASADVHDLPALRDEWETAFN
jgi:putative DNA primase/helicase